MEYSKICPDCKETIIFKSYGGYRMSVKKNRLCRKCSKTGNRNNFYGKHHTEETKKNLHKNRDYSVYRTDEFKYKISEIVKHRHKLNPQDSFYNIWIKKYGKEIADEKYKILQQLHSKNNKGCNNPMFGKSSPKGSGNGWSGWYNGWYFRSLKELSYMINVIERFKMSWITAENRDLMISYVDYDKTYRNYFADFLINNRYMVEIKPKKLFNTPKNKLKKESAILWCKKRGYIYKLLDAPKLELETIFKLYDKNKITFLKKYDDKFKKILKEKNLC